LWNDTDRADFSTRRETGFSSTLFATNLTLTGPDLNPGHCGAMSVTNLVIVQKNKLRSRQSLEFNST
jgi:hypothetical protein